MVFPWFSHDSPPHDPRLRGGSKDFHIDRNLDTVLGALRRLGIEAEKKGRNDAWVELWWAVDGVTNWCLMVFNGG